MTLPIRSTPPANPQIGQMGFWLNPTRWVKAWSATRSQLRFSIGGIAQRTVSPGPADRFVLVAAGVSLVVEEEPASSSLPAPPEALVADEVDLVLLKLSP